MQTEFQGQQGGGLPAPRNYEDYKSLCLRLIPSDTRAYYEDFVLSTLDKSGVIKTPEDWKSYHDSLKEVPMGCRTEYSRDVLLELRQSGAINGPEDWMTHAINYRDSLKEIPQADASDYTRNALPELIRTKKLRTPGDWESYRDSLKEIDPQERTGYTRYALPALLRTGAITNRDDWKIHAKNYRLSLGELPYEDEETPDSKRYAFTSLIGTGAIKTAEDWKNYNDNLAQIPKEDRISYTEIHLPELIKTKKLKTPGDWEHYRDSLKEVPRGLRSRYTGIALPRIAKTDTFSWERVFEQLKIIHDYAKAYGDTYFIWKTGFDNFGELHPIDGKGRPLCFSKTGSGLRVLDGHRSGVLIRTIPETGYKTWVKALESGIPCEEILKYPPGHRKAGQYRAKPAGEGNVRVACLWGGLDLQEFLSNPDNKGYEQEVYKQRDRIKSQLESNQIDHGHTHDRNFVVRLIDNKPIVRVIDFDQAQNTGSPSNLRDVDLYDL